MSESFNVRAVIELNAGDFAIQDYYDPKDQNFDWSAYWKKSLNDAGLTKVAQITPGVPLVDITKIEDEELSIIVQKTLESSDFFETSRVSSFEGGLVIKQGELEISPTCCISIGDYQEWQKILDENSEKWKQIWIGHPWVFARIRNDKMELSDYSEGNDWSGAPLLSLDLNEFVRQFNEITAVIDVFRQRLEKILMEMGIKEARNVACELVDKT